METSTRVLIGALAVFLGGLLYAVLAAFDIVGLVLPAIIITQVAGVMAHITTVYKIIRVRLFSKTSKRSRSKVKKFDRE